MIADYERRNRIAGPVVRAVFSRLAGFHYDGSAESRQQADRNAPSTRIEPY